jgi:hypothetical protein
MKKLIIVSALVIGLAAFQTKENLIPTAQIWADCMTFRTVATPTSLNPGHGPFDELYTTPDGFKDGIMSISEAKPGDADYNGGRWHVNELAPGVDPSKYENACSVEDLDLADFVSTDTYFVCPLLPIRR